MEDTHGILAAKKLRRSSVGLAHPGAIPQGGSVLDGHFDHGYHPGSIDNGQFYVTASYVLQHYVRIECHLKFVKQSK